MKSNTVLCIFLMFFAVAILYFVYCNYITNNQRRLDTSKQFNLQVPKKDVPGKTIWFVWFQGLENAPELVKEVYDSWKRFNPDWNVEVLSDTNIHEYIDVPYLRHDIPHAARSDIIRLTLLSTYGGVWADATCLCLHPLDTWIYPALEPAGFWMYHGRDYGKGPCSWFIISQKQSYIIREWKRRCDDYWQGREQAHDYFWMDELFQQALDEDPAFQSEWDIVPYLWCEEVGQSHMMAERCDHNNPELKRILEHEPPYVVKMTHHGSEGFAKDSNAWFAIQMSKRAHVPRKIFPMLQLHPMPPFGDKVVVVADCKDPTGIRELQDRGSKYGFELVVYDKCNFCAHVPDGVYCRPLPNVGREGHTFLHFVILHYERLPHELIFIPSVLGKYERSSRFQHLLEDSHHTGCEETIGLGDFILEEYENFPISPADFRPFSHWYKRYIGPWSNKSVPCWNGLMRTNRQRILEHPKLFYQNILTSISAADRTEVGHFVERCMGDIF